MVRMRKQTISEEDGTIKAKLSPGIKNVVVFGESGVGKSSLVNLVAGEKVCETSSGALGCTLEYKRHPLELDGQLFAVWDTTGLDEGTQGSVPADKAEAYLRQLLHELAKNNGVDLLVYCVRGTRVRTALLTNYHIFYSAICRKKVPIAIVVTGLENQEGNMETWWDRNEPQFSQLKMHFDGHACVTTLTESYNQNPCLVERRMVSKAAVIKMITSTCRTQQWKPPERSWVESAYSDIRAMLSPRDSCGTRLAAVIMCDTTRDRPGGRLMRKRSISFQNPVTFSLSLNPISFRSPLSISNDALRSKLPDEEGIKYTPQRLYRVYQVLPKQPLPEGTGEEIRKVSVVKRGADLLIFCARMEESESKVVKFQWEHFHSTYCGDLSPLIVLVVGAGDQATAEKWWKGVGEMHSKSDVDVAYWPKDATGTEVEVARRHLQHLIHDRCIDCSKVTFVRDEKLFRRSLFLELSDLATLWTKLECTSMRDEPSPAGQDMLTKVGVWYDITERSPSIASPVSPVWSAGQ